MAGRYGVLTASDATLPFGTTEGQQEVFDQTVEYFNQYRTDLLAAEAIFVFDETEEFKVRYRLPGGGMMQRAGRQAQAHAVKADGYWDVGLPLEKFEDQLAGDDVTLAYMTAAQYNLQVETIRLRHLNRRRAEMLGALLNNTQRSFLDERHGTILVEPLANGDGILYPPTLAGGPEATADNYVEAGYAAITNTNNPYPTIVARLANRFGIEQGGSNIVTFINSAQQAETEALASFVGVEDRFTRPGTSEPVLQNSPRVPGTIIGRTNGTWVSVWPAIPAIYLLGIHLGAQAPLMRRVHPAFTGLQRGLHLASTDSQYPFRQAHWRDYFGYGVGNRLNGVVVELANGGTYTVPAAYA